MHLTDREWWGLIHGMVLGAAFLLAFAGGVAELHALRPAAATLSGLRSSARRIGLGVGSMAILAWLTVLTGTYVVYPWYRAKDPGSPKSVLVKNPATADWHNFAMEWKEHIAWLSPILATAAAFIVVYYGRSLAENNRVRRLALALLLVAFVAAGVAGAFGALITKAAPVQ
jgi:hypothetical protein